MYPSRGNNSYGQPSYPSQSSYGQSVPNAQTQPGYPGQSAGQDSSSQLSMGSHHPSMLGGQKETDIGGYRAHPPSSAQYGGQYNSLYASASLGSGQQVSALNAKGSGPQTLEGHSNYGTSTDSPKYISADYVSSSSHGYGHNPERLNPEKMVDYATLERRQYAERQGIFMGRDLAAEAGGIGYSSHHQSEMHDRLDQASLLRQEHMLKSQSLQHASHEGTRHADYLAVRSGTFRHPTQELVTYGGRSDADPRVPVVGSSYTGQPAPSILGVAPQRNTDDLMYVQSSSNPGYGVSLPPGRDYGIGKGLHGTIESDYQGSISSRSAHSRLDDPKNDRYARELDIREDERRRDRLRDRERERDRERDREKERERQRLLDILLKERERDRERKRALERRSERTPPRRSSDRRGSSLTKDAKSSRRDSPRREILHRIRSPVKEKRREYVCKVYTSCLVDAERDYLSLDKRYPRLYVSPDFSKVVVNWPREDLKLPMHTPVSFEHDFIEGGEHQKQLSTKQPDMDANTSEQRSIVWNAKMILMSGLSRSAIEDLNAEKILDDRVPHICNILRFAVLKKDRSFLAIGGPWNPVDGGDPSIDDSSLVRTVLRYAKDLTNLDLQNCQRWIRFLEIHYDRIGNDGLFSHKEITVLYVPDLSDCLPSLDAWREQWLAYRKAITEHAKQREQKSRDKKVSGKAESGSASAKDGKGAEKSEKKESIGALKASEKGGDMEKTGSAKKKAKKETKKTSEVKDIEKKGEGVDTTTTEGVKPGKKKVVRKIVKQKVADKKVISENGSNEDIKSEVKASKVKVVSTETSVQKDPPSADALSVKTFTRKKVAKKVPETNVALNVGTESTENKSAVKSDATGATPVRSAPVKRMIKRKIIKRVPKKKAPGGEASNVTTDNKTNSIEVEDGKTVDKVNGTDIVSENVGIPSKPGNKPEKVTEMEVERTDEKDSASKKVAIKDDKDPSKEKAHGKDKPKDVKGRKDKDGKDEPRGKSGIEIDRKKAEEPPRPGFIVQTKNDKDARVRSMSLSLESLLDYSDKDVEESTFELSLFAESLYEMLQYQMGSRVLAFLQKLRVKFVTKRNRRKRQREQASEKQEKERTEAKRLKSEQPPKDEKSTNPEVKEEPHSNLENAVSKADNANDGTDRGAKGREEEKLEVEEIDEEVEEMDEEVEEMDEEEVEEEEEEEDPEEDPEEDEEMEEDSTKEKNNEEVKTDVELNQIETDKQESKELTNKDKTVDGEKKTSIEGETSKPKEEKAESSKKTLAAKQVPVDKELLQAFRFFDRNRAGYIRVEDMRLVLHNLGKFLSHRDVKELVQSALLESNTGRDDRILYEKLVRMFSEFEQS